MSILSGKFQDKPKQFFDAEIKIRKIYACIPE